MLAGLGFEGLRIARAGHLMAALDSEVAPGEVLTVMGPSGSGKSTLLAVVIGSPPPGLEVTGRVRLDGRDLSGLPPQDRHVGILFQDQLLFPHMSVGGNLAFGLPSSVRGRAARRAAVEAALSDVGLAGFAPRDPATLSGGQRTRVALMRTLLSEPRALLLDEPFSGLDMARRNQIRDLVFTQARDRRLPVLLVTHDEADAHAAGGQIINLPP
jgi:putative thiamine transport system ATP-binding protein